MQRIALVATLLVLVLGLPAFGDAVASKSGDAVASKSGDAVASKSGDATPSKATAPADTAASNKPAATPTKDDAPALASQMEGIKHDLVLLKRDLTVLEENLLYPASSQVAVFLSMDVGEFFALDSVQLKLNGKDVTNYLYTKKQVDALFRGGVQRLYVGNVKQGSNELTAFFTGRGPQGRDYRRATTVKFDKTFEPSYIELKISDSTAKYQPEFVATVSQ